MATPKEQHDARSNARTIGHAHRRTPPADATPPGGVPAMPRARMEPPGAVREPRPREPVRGDPPHLPNASPR